MIKISGRGDFEYMRTVMGALSRAKAGHGNLQSERAFFIEIGDRRVLVVNSPRFPSSACLSRTLVEGVIPEAERPEELKMVSPAEFVVAMRPGGAAYDTVLFHELVHSQQIRKMWNRRGIDLSGMGDRMKKRMTFLVVKNLRDFAKAIR